MLRDKPAKVREKQRKSAVSALGHFLSWSVEMGVFAATAVTHFQLSVSEGERWIVFAREGAQFSENIFGIYSIMIFQTSHQNP